MRGEVSLKVWSQRCFLQAFMVPSIKFNVWSNILAMSKKHLTDCRTTVLNVEAMFYKDEKKTMTTPNELMKTFETYQSRRIRDRFIKEWKIFLQRKIIV